MKPRPGSYRAAPGARKSHLRHASCCLAESGAKESWCDDTHQTTGKSGREQATNLHSTNPAKRQNTALPGLCGKAQERDPRT